MVCQGEACGVTLSGTQRKWCAEHLSEAQRSAPRDSLAKSCTENGCDRPLRARGMCAMHWRRWNRAQGNEKSEWDDRRRDNYHRRRATAYGAPYGARAFLSDVIQRDGTVCSLCSEPVDLALEWPDPLSKSLDHEMPLSLGGAHEFSNCRLAHLRCNVRKGNRAA